MADQSDMVLLNNVVFLLTCSFELPVLLKNLQVASENWSRRERTRWRTHTYIIYNMLRFMHILSDLIRSPPRKAGAALHYLIDSLLKHTTARVDLSQCMDQKVHKRTKYAILSRLL